jgi:hypothetical protein
MGYVTQNPTPLLEPTLGWAPLGGRRRRRGDCWSCRSRYEKTTAYDVVFHRRRRRPRPARPRSLSAAIQHVAGPESVNTNSAGDGTVTLTCTPRSAGQVRGPGRPGRLRSPTSWPARGLSCHAPRSCTVKGNGVRKPLCDDDQRHGSGWTSPPPGRTPADNGGRCPPPSSKPPASPNADCLDQPGRYADEPCQVLARP